MLVMHVNRRLQRLKVSKRILAQLANTQERKGRATWIIGCDSS